MNAGWYRYVMEWRFAPDGTIRPRYGFASTANSCVCNPRIHHVYWRFDFDIVQPNNKVFQIERGRKFMKQILTEAAIFRNYQTNRSFLIQNANGDEAYILTPGSNDGSVADRNGNLIDTFGAGDIWLLKFQGTPNSPGELDDPNTGPAANLNPWVSGESIDNQDIVIWYAAHQYRSDDISVRNQRNEVISGLHVIGPTLKPVRW
jgi:Cu2+-containing amine oxidase